MTLGSRICDAREIAGLTTNQLAQRIGVMPKTLRNWEADRSEPRANKMVTLAGILGVSMAWLSNGEEVGDPGGGVPALEETRPLKVKLARVQALHEQTSRLLLEIQSDIERLQGRIDRWEYDMGPEGDA